MIRETMASDRAIGLEALGRMRVFTVGHSTHSLDGLCALLVAHDVTRVADVRRVPRSARHPQFRAESLAIELPARGVDYRHMLALGGHRRPMPDSPNGAWDNDAFRGYADYALRSSTPRWTSCARSPAIARRPSCAPRACGGAATGG
jgi:uncharacterized protein (DUF488 family)